MIAKSIYKTMIIFILLNLFAICESKIEILLTFENNNELNSNFLYCDDLINFYGTSKLNVYKVNDDNENINVNSELELFKTDSNYICENIVSYKSDSNKQKIIVEMIDNPDSVEGLFMNSNSNSIEIKSGDFSNYIDISYMFYECTKLSSVNLHNFNFAEALFLDNLFYNCHNLEEIIWPNLEIFSPIYTIDYMFYNCSKLSSIDLSKFSFNETVDMEGLFLDCINLKTIIFPNESNNLDDFIFATGMFLGCASLTSVDLTFLFFQGEVNFDYMFLNCSKMEEIKLRGNLDFTDDDEKLIINIKYPWEMSSFKVGVKDIFKNCYSLKNVDLFYFNINNNYTYELIKDLNNLEGCLFNIFNNEIKKCSKYMGFYYCGECKNINTDEYCIKEIEGINYTFYYLFGHFDLIYNERNCYWSANYESFDKYTFVNNSGSGYSYYVNYCENFCEICSKDYQSCTKCKNNFYPINTDFNDYISGQKESYKCYEIGKMNNFYFDEEIFQFKKCEEKCSECSFGVDMCSLCNYSGGYYKIEDQEYNCSKLPPSENYKLDIESKTWLKCNNRCKKCSIQSKSELDHQCTSCYDNYYPYQIDYNNYLNKAITGFNCYLKTEVKEKSLNYYLNSDGLFEKCDISCLECENENNQCKKCNINYYEIFGNKNGTCFHDPLENYGLIETEGEILLKKCYYLCRYCTQITESFFYQQCKGCDEINYTLDLFSYQKSFCIPKDKSNSPFIKYQAKWYIENFEGMENLEIINKNKIIDYELLLNDIKYGNINYTIVDECPPDKPFIIYSIRQCVSSCNSSNLVEFGLFMTKKLYSYNNICYDECPHGSIKDDDKLICNENIQYTQIDNNTTISNFIENNQNNIIDYLTNYTNNSVGITRLNDLSNFFYDESLNNSIKIELNMAIFDFNGCIEKLRASNQLDDKTNIFIGIMEFDTQRDSEGKYNLNSNPVNFTTYQFFTDNGTILNYSVCFNIEIKVEKKVDTNKINFDLLEEFEKYDINLYENDKELNDYCIPLSINNKDLTVYNRHLLIKKYQKPCDDNCIFESFNYLTNYSTCLCKIIPNDYNEMTKEIIIDKLRDNVDEIDSLFDLLEKGNLKYFKCFIESFKYTKYGHINILAIISFIFISAQIILFFLYCNCEHRDIIEKFDNVKNKDFKKYYGDNETINIHHFKKDRQSVKTKKRIINNYITKTDRGINDNDNHENQKENEEEIDYLDLKYKDYEEAIEKMKVKKYCLIFCKIFCKYFWEKICFCFAYEDSEEIINDYNNCCSNFCGILCDCFRKKIFCCVDCKRKKCSSDYIFIKLILTIFSIHTYLFINALFFSDKYISSRFLFDREIEGTRHIIYILLNEIERVVNSLLLSFTVTKFIIWIIYDKTREYLYKIKQDELQGTKKADRIKLLKGLYKCKINSFLPIILVFQCVYFYYLFIFGNINSNSQIPLLFSLILSYLLYFILYLIFALFSSIFKSFALNIRKNYECCFGFYKLSSFLSNFIIFLMIIFIYVLINKYNN